MSTLLLDIFITGFILIQYITIGYIYRLIYCQQVHYYWIYLSLDWIYLSLVNKYIIIGYIVNEYITIKDTYH